MQADTEPLHHQQQLHNQHAGHQQLHDSFSQDERQNSMAMSNDELSGSSPQLSITATSQKRKRDSVDQDMGDSPTVRRTSFKRSSPAPALGGSFMPVNASESSFTSMDTTPHHHQQQQPHDLSINGSNNSDAHTLHQMQSLMALQAQNAIPNVATDPNLDPAFTSLPEGSPSEHHNPTSSTPNLTRSTSAGAITGGNSSTPAKPPVGSDDWHRLRKDNHKEVERRRRETINEGINELAKIVPNCEKNKGSILQKAVSYITDLKRTEASNIERWGLEKILTEQAINELSAANDKLKADLERAWREAETWKKACASAGVTTTNAAAASTTAATANPS